MKDALCSRDSHWRLHRPWKELAGAFTQISKPNKTFIYTLMAVIPRGVVLGLLFYLTFAIAGTIWISMKYLNENECDCSQYLFGKSKLSSSVRGAHEHDFPHLRDDDRIVTEKRKRAEGNSLQATANGKRTVDLLSTFWTSLLVTCRSIYDIVICLTPRCSAGRIFLFLLTFL